MDCEIFLIYRKANVNVSTCFTEKNLKILVALHPAFNIYHLIFIAYKQTIFLINHFSKKIVTSTFFHFPQAKSLFSNIFKSRLLTGAF